jgi:hypothetical protein
MGQLRIALFAIAFFLGVIALRPFFTPEPAQAQSPRFEHVQILATTFLYKGQQGLLVLDKRNGNVWFIQRQADAFQDPVFVIRMQWEKLDQAPQ